MIDLRSDVLGGLPDTALRAMMDAADDPPAFDLGEDPHQNELEEMVADLFGFERALFVPTGTMANQIALRLHCAPGETVIAERNSHVAVNEAASTSGLNGAVLYLIDGERGHPTAMLVAGALAATPRSAADRGVGLIWLENTHNRAGGTVMPLSLLAELVDLCGNVGKPLHLDGARLWNAVVATGAPPEALTKGVDSACISLNKAVGAPVGALLLGRTAFIEEAARVRRMFGGWWRPVGMLAAAALAAVRDSQDRLAADHAHAARFAAELRALLPTGFFVTEPDTNIVMLRPPEEMDTGLFVGALRSRGVRASNYGRAGIRFVFHARIIDDHITAAIEAIATGIGELAEKG